VQAAQLNVGVDPEGLTLTMRLNRCPSPWIFIDFSVQAPNMRTRHVFMSKIPTQAQLIFYLSATKRGPKEGQLQPILLC
jgi:hypothetical protein